MWLLHFLPDSLLHFIVDAVLFAGVVGSLLFFVVLNRLLRSVPALAPYYKLGQAVSAVLLVAGVYFRGGVAAEDAWRERVREMEARVTVAEQAAAEANQKLEQKAEQKVKVVRERGRTVTQYIQTEIVKRDNQCQIPQEFVRAHNMAAERVK